MYKYIMESNVDIVQYCTISYCPFSFFSSAGLLKQLLKYDNFVLVIMSFTGKGANSASPELFEGDSLLPLILKKVTL